LLSRDVGKNEETYFIFQAASKGKKEQERYTALMEKLQEEKKKQHEHVEKVMARLKQVLP